MEIVEFLLRSWTDQYTEKPFDPSIRLLNSVHTRSSTPDLNTGLCRVCDSYPPKKIEDGHAE